MIAFDWSTAKKGMCFKVEGFSQKMWLEKQCPIDPRCVEVSIEPMVYEFNETKTFKKSALTRFPEGDK